MATASASTVDYIMKRVYSSQKIENQVARDRSFLSWVPKEGNFVGTDYRYVVPFANAFGVADTLSTAITNSDYDKGAQFAITRVKKYGVTTIDAEFIQSTKDMGAFVAGLKSQVDSTLDELGHRLAIDLYGGVEGAAVIGVVSAVNSLVITLTRADDVKNFGKGMLVDYDDTVTGASKIGTGMVVTGIDEDAGTITVDDTTPGGAAAVSSTNKYLFLNGTAASTAMSGLSSWLPLTAPDSTAFFGVDRTQDIGRLSGWRVDSTSNTLEENIITLGMKIARAGGKTDAIFMNPTNFGSFVKQLGSKAIRDESGQAEFGYTGIKYAAPSGTAKVMIDPECPTSRVYMLQRNTWKLKYLGPGIPHRVTDDGLESLRGATTDDVQVRFRYWCNLLCTAPGKNGVMSV